MKFSNEFFDNKKLIGLIGGMSSQATLKYYELINSYINAQKGGHEIAELAMYSVNFGNIERFVEVSDWESGYTYLRDKALRLKEIECDFYLMVSNTMHVVADRLQRDVDLPLLHIADSVAETLENEFVKNIGILGTMPVMSEDYYKGFYKDRGFNVEVPSQDDMEIVNRIIFEELCHGLVKEDSKKELYRITTQFVEKGCRGVLLACTELGMAMEQKDYSQISLFDTLDIHVRKAVELSLN